MEDSVGEEVKEEGEEMSHTKDTEATRSARHLWPNFIWIFRVTMDGGAWWAAVHGVAKSWTRLSEFPFTFHVHALEKEMATHSNVLFFFFHSNVLAWRIPGTGEPGGLPHHQGSHRVGHD